MSERLFAAVACAWLIGSTIPLRAQSLAEVARKEEERRKAIATPSKVITNGDLRPVTARPPAADAKAENKEPEKAPAEKETPPKDTTKEPATKDAATKDAAAAKEPAKEPVKDKAYWTDRLKSLQEQLARDETYAEALQSRINALTTDFINRDDPAQKRVLEQTRLTAIAELDRLKQHIPEDKKAIADFQEEARRAGIPPGWLR